MVGAFWDDVFGPDSGSAYVFRIQGGDWVQTQKLLPSHSDANDQFGRAVAINGDAILSAALLHSHSDESNNGSVYTFSRSGIDWSEDQELLASDGAVGDGFGYSVAIGGDVAMVGAPSHDHGAGFASGSAYVLRLDPATSDWIEEAELIPLDSVEGLGFGASVSLSGHAAVIGAPGDSSACPNDPNCGNGAAYVFRFDEEAELWEEEAKLVASDAAWLDRFGWSVSVSGHMALSGAHFDDDNGSTSGSAYVFGLDPETSEWVEQQKLLASDGLPGDQFGRAVAMDGNLAVIGAWKADPVNFSSGAAYVFRFDGQSWVEVAKLVPEPNAWTQFFGYSVDIDGTRAIIGAYGEDTQEGAAYIFDLSYMLPDLDVDGDVDAADLAMLLGTWGPCPQPCEAGDPAHTCPADLTGDCAVGAFDLAILLGNWG